MVALCGFEVLERREFLDGLEHRSYKDESTLGANSDFGVDQNGSERVWSDGVPVCLDTWCHPVRVNF